MKQKTVCAAILMLHVWGNLTLSHAQQYQYAFQNPQLPLEQRVDNVISLLTLEEKIAAFGNPAVPRSFNHAHWPVAAWALPDCRLARRIRRCRSRHLRE